MSKKEVVDVDFDSQLPPPPAPYSNDSNDSKERDEGNVSADNPATESSSYSSNYTKPGSQSSSDLSSDLPLLEELNNLNLKHSESLTKDSSVAEKTGVESETSAGEGEMVGSSERELGESENVKLKPESEGKTKSADNVLSKQDIELQRKWVLVGLKLESAKDLLSLANSSKVIRPILLDPQFICSWILQRSSVYLAIHDAVTKHTPIISVQIIQALLNHGCHLPRYTALIASKTLPDSLSSFFSDLGGRLYGSLTGFNAKNAVAAVPMSDIDTLPVLNAKMGLYEETLGWVYGLSKEKLTGLDPNENGYDDQVNDADVFIYMLRIYNQLKPGISLYIPFLSRRLTPADFLTCFTNYFYII
jgi:hypothetical protein